MKASKLNPNIASAHVATFGERVVDVFRGDGEGAAPPGHVREPLVRVETSAAACIFLFLTPACARRQP